MKRHFQIGWVLLWSVFALTGCRFEGTSATNSSLSSNSSPTASSSSSASSQESNSSSPSSSTVNPDVLVDATPYLKMEFVSDNGDPFFVINGYRDDLPARISLPETYTVTGIGTYPVKGFLNNPFADCLTLKEIAIPKSMTIATSYLFSIQFSFSGCVSLEKITGLEGMDTYPDVSNCLSLKSVHIPASIKKITSFSGCRSLQSFSVDPGNRKFSTDGRALFSNQGSVLVAYADASGTSYAVPNQVVVIEKKAFYSSDLQNVTLPSSVTDIRAYAFSRSSLTQIELPTSIAALGNYVFSDCAALSKVALPSNLKSIPDQTFFRCISLTSFVIPNQVTAIGDYAFNGCTHLKTIAFSSSLLSVGASAFSQCLSLESLQIPASLTKIDYTAFAGCAGLKTISVDSANSTFITDGRSLIALTYTFGRYSPQYTDPCLWVYANKSGTTYTIPSNVVRSSSCVFEGCTDLISLSIPATTQGIGSVSGCRSLTTFVVDSANTVLSTDGRALFVRPSSSSSDVYFAAYAAGSGPQYVIPNQVTHLSEGSFKNCSTLTSLTIPASLKWIESSSLAGCTFLSSLSFTGTKAQWLSLITRVGDVLSFPDVPAAFVTCSDGIVTL